MTAKNPVGRSADVDDIRAQRRSRTRGGTVAEARSTCATYLEHSMHDARAAADVINGHDEVLSEIAKLIADLSYRGVGYARGKSPKMTRGASIQQIENEQDG